MTERFAYTTGTISVANGASSVTGTGTAWSGRDREGSQIWYRPAGSPAAPPQLIGIVAAIVPRGQYEDLTLPLVTPWTGDTLANVDYIILDGPAIANGVTQAAVYARFVAHLEQNMGLVGNTADDTNYDLVQENSLFIDDVSRVIYQWRDGVLNEVYAVGLPFTPKGAYAGGTTYAENDLVSHGGAVFVSNADTNLGNTPTVAPSPASSVYWTHFPVPGVAEVLIALGITGVTISTAAPSGGSDGNLWLRLGS